MVSLTFYLINSNECEERLGFHVDKGFAVKDDNEIIGEIYISEIADNEDYQIPVDNSVFVEWIHIFHNYQKEGYLRKIFFYLLENLHKASIVFESSDEHVSMYQHLKASIIRYDPFRNITVMKLNKEDM